MTSQHSEPDEPPLPLSLLTRLTDLSIFSYSTVSSDLSTLTNLTSLGGTIVLSDDDLSPLTNLVRLSMSGMSTVTDKSFSRLQSLVSLHVSRGTMLWKVSDSLFRSLPLLRPFHCSRAFCANLHYNVRACQQKQCNEALIYCRSCLRAYEELRKVLGFGLGEESPLLLCDKHMMEGK